MLALLDADLASEGALQLLLQLGNVVHGNLGRLLRLLDRFFVHALGQRLRLTDRQADHLSGCLYALIRFVYRKDCPRVTAGDFAFADHRPHLVRQSQQTQCVRYRRTGLDHALGHLLLRQSELLHQTLITFGFFDRVQVLPLQIFDQCQLHDLVFLSLKHHRRNVFQTCLTCCTPAALTCNDLVVAVLLALAHRNWCDDAVQANALCQLVQRYLIKDLPRLIGIRLDFCQRQVFCAVIQTFFH